MKRLAAVVLLLGALGAARAAEHSSEFVAPWRDESKALVIDPYQGNSIDWDKLAEDKRVVAIIHKATEGLSTDKEYAARKKEALKRGYRWGSYHVGRPGDPVKQAEHYLKVAEPGADELMALDLEAIGSDFMSLADAKKFIEQIAKASMRHPLLYVNHASARDISATVGKDEVFSACPLWYARFREDIPDFPQGTWTTYALWQFSSEVNCRKQGGCLYNVPGVRFDMDVNVFSGTPQELRDRWPLSPRSE